MADFTRYEFQLRQRLTSTGLNTARAWSDRLSVEALHRLVSLDIRSSGVIAGLVASVQAGTLNVQVGGGIGLFYDATQVAPDNLHRWIEIDNGAPVTVTLDPGDASPRWDVVEIIPGSAAGVGEVLDFYNPNTGAFAPAAVTPLKVCTPTVQVRKGTPAASPKLPAGVAGVLPLAYVYVANGAVVLDANRVLHCRPILTPKNGVWRGESPVSLFSPYQESQNVAGGGWVIDADGLAGSLANTMTGTFPNGGLPFFLPSGTNISISTVGNYVDGGLPVANRVVYAYAAPPPYPAGYDVRLAPRELFIQDTTTPGINATIPIASRNCVVVIANAEPGAAPNGAPGGPHVTYSFIDAGIFGNYTLQRASMIYVGAAFYALAVPGMTIQRVMGSWIAPQRKTGFKFDADLPIAGTEVYNLWLNIAGDDAMEFPATARRLSVAGEFNLLTTGDIFIEIEDSWTGGGGHGLVNIAVTNQSASTNDIGGTYELCTDEDGNIIISAATVQDIAGGGAKFRTRAYEDAVLSSR